MTIFLIDQWLFYEEWLLYLCGDFTTFVYNFSNTENFGANIHSAIGQSSASLVDHLSQHLTLILNFHKS